MMIFWRDIPKGLMSGLPMPMKYQGYRKDLYVSHIRPSAALKRLQIPTGISMGSSGTLRSAIPLRGNAFLKIVTELPGNTVPDCQEEPPILKKYLPLSLSTCSPSI